MRSIIVFVRIEITFIDQVFHCSQQTMLCSYVQCCVSALIHRCICACEHARKFFNKILGYIYPPRTKGNIKWHEQLLISFVGAKFTHFHQVFDCNQWTMLYCNMQSSIPILIHRCICTRDHTREFFDKILSYMQVPSKDGSMEWCLWIFVQIVWVN